MRRHLCRLGVCATAFVATGSQFSAAPFPVAGPTYMKALNPGASDQFGSAVSMSGHTLVVGSPWENGSGLGVNPPVDNLGFGTGAAYVFGRTNGAWRQEAYLKATNRAAGFGFSVALSGDTVVVGSPYEYGSGTGVNPPIDFNAEYAGAAYVYVRRNGTWSPQAYLKASNTEAQAFFGVSVAISGNTIAVGAPGENGDGLVSSGAVYVFVRTGETWSQQAYLKASNPTRYHYFGSAVGLSADTLVVGVPSDSKGGTGVNPPPGPGGNSGAAHIFTRTATTWTHDAYLKAFHPSGFAYFGRSVAVSGNTVIVGAPGEPGSGTGVNPQPDSAAPDAGAVFFFERSGATWSQGAYLKAGNTGAGDSFGYSVAIDTHRVVVGAHQEGGSGTGVNPPSNNSADRAGATYVFARAGSNLSQQAYLKASNTGGQDEFGFSVALSGNLIAVGAPREDGSGAGISPHTDEAANLAGAAYVFSAPSVPSVVHLDSDNTGDLFLYSAGSGRWSRQLGRAGADDALGQYEFVEHSSGRWSPAWSIDPASFNDDERTDFFLVHPTGVWVRVLTDASEFTTQASGQWWTGWQRHVMNLDADGISDLFLHDPETGTWFKCLSTPSGFNCLQGGWNPGWEIYPMDMNGDAFDDLFLFDRTTGRWFWAFGQNGNAFTYPVTEAWFPGWQLHPGDFNGDGLTDLLLHDPTTGTYFVATTGASGFTYARGGWSLGLSPHVADFNADSVDDVFLHDLSTGTWFVAIGDGLGGFTNAGSGTWALGWTLNFTDVDGDARADILLYDPANGVWFLARNLVNGSFSYTSGSWAPGLTIVSRAPIR